METFVSSYEGIINRKVFMGRLNCISHNLSCICSITQGYQQSIIQSGSCTVDICTSISRLKLLRVCGLLCKWSVTLHQIDGERDKKKM